MKKETSTERVKAHQERVKARKAHLETKGYKEIPLLIKIEQIDLIKATSKKTGDKDHTKLLFAITQPAIEKFCNEIGEALYLKQMENLKKELNI